MPTVYRLFDAGAQFFDDNGDPYAGGKLFTYSPGSSTKKTAYQESGGTTPHANPIVLDAAGRLPAPVWGTTGGYKFVLAPSTDTDPPASPEWTEDNVSGINDTASTSIDQWSDSGVTPTYVSATSFTLVGDQTTAFHAGRRVKTANSGGTRYGRITAASYSAPNTTVTVLLDSGSLDAGLSAVSLGVATWANPSIPFDGLALIVAKTASGAADISFTEFNSSLYSAYLFVIESLQPATDGTTLGVTLSSDGGATYISTSVYQSYRVDRVRGSASADNSGTAALATISTAIGNQADEVLSGTLRLQANRGRGVFEVTYANGSTVFTISEGGFHVPATVNGIKFAMASGNESGTIYMYGFRK